MNLTTTISFDGGTRRSLWASLESRGAKEREREKRKSFIEKTGGEEGEGGRYGIIRKPGTAISFILPSPPWPLTFFFSLSLSLHQHSRGKKVHCGKRAWRGRCEVENERDVTRKIEGSSRCA